MSANGCRIGRIKPKAGGATIRQLNLTQRDEAQKNLVDRAAIISGFYEPGEIHGYVVFAWTKDGYTSIGYMISQEGVVGARLLPSFVADALRSRMIQDGDWEY